MPPEHRSDDDEKALENVRELFKTLIGTSGIILALLLGLTQQDTAATVLTLICIASGILLISILGSLIGLQFIVAELERHTQRVTKERTVAFSFLAAWLSFIIGCILLIVAIFNIGPQVNEQKVTEKPASTSCLASDS